MQLLAVPKHCLRRCAYFTNDLEMEADLLRRQSTEVKDEFLRLVDTANVLMEGLRPRVMARLKIGGDDVPAQLWRRHLQVPL